MDGWLDSQWFTGFLQKKWRVVLCATYLASFCVLHLPDRLHSVWSSGSVGGIYLNIFESGFSLRQSWQVWKLIGTSHMSQQRMKGFWRSLAVWAGEHVNEDLPAHMFFHHLEAIYPYRKQWEHTKHEIIGKTWQNWSFRFCRRQLPWMTDVFGQRWSISNMYANVQPKFGDIMTQVGVVSYCQGVFWQFFGCRLLPPNTRVVNKNDLLLPPVGSVYHSS